MMLVKSLRHELVVLYTRSRHEVMTCSRGLVAESSDSMYEDIQSLIHSQNFQLQQVTK